MRGKIAALLMALAVCLIPATGLAQQKKPAARPAGAIDRTVLPVPEPQRPPITVLDVRKATPPPRFEVKAPKGAPRSAWDPTAMPL